MRLHLIDGTFELFRSFFGAPPRSDPSGAPVSAVHGIVVSTLALLEDGATHVGVAFDTVISSFRNDLYPGYKTGEGVPEELLVQFPWAEEAVASLGVTVWGMREYEADDAIASAVEKYAGAFDQVVIMSPDKDLAQCVQGDRVVTFDRRQGAFVDEVGVIAKFGVAPDSIPDYLGLVGDSADGFPGVRGWGAKSASAMLAEYRHIENIPLEADLWKPEVRGAARLVESLRTSMGDALLFRFLAVLRRDVPLTEEVEDLRWKGVPRDRFLEVMDRFGFETLKGRPKTWV